MRERVRERVGDRERERESEREKGSEGGREREKRKGVVILRLFLRPSPFTFDTLLFLLFFIFVSRPIC